MTFGAAGDRDKGTSERSGTAGGFRVITSTLFIGSDRKKGEFFSGRGAARGSRLSEHSITTYLVATHLFCMTCTTTVPPMYHHCTTFVYMYIYIM